MQTIRTNLRNSASSQYSNFNFTSFCELDGELYGAGPDGFFKIGACDDDNGKDVDARFETFYTGWEHDGKNKVRFVYLTIETGGDVIVTPIVDDVEQTPVTFSAVTPGKQVLRKPVAHDVVGWNWKFRIENVDGCWFALKKFEALPINLSLGR